MYAKCGSVEDAFNVFDKNFVRDVISWTTMISIYAYPHKTLKSHVTIEDPCPVIVDATFWHLIYLRRYPSSHPLLLSPPGCRVFCQISRASIRWNESAGVLAVLLKASVKDNYLLRQH